MFRNPRPVAPARFAALTTLVTLAACGADIASPARAGTRALSVSFTAGAPRAATAARSPLAPRLTIDAAANGHTISVSRVQVVLAKLELREAGTACPDADDHGGSAGDHDGCRELALAPRVIDVPLGAGAPAAIRVDVPAGSYSALEAKVAAAPSLDAAHPDLAGASVRVEGTYDGAPFVWSGTVRSRLEFSFEPPLSVDVSGINLTVDVDVASWFRDAQGALVDPASALPGQPNAAVVSANVARSFRAFRDDDHDGRDDHGGDGSRGHESEGGDDHGHGSDG